MYYIFMIVPCILENQRKYQTVVLGYNLQVVALNEICLIDLAISIIPPFFVARCGLPALPCIAMDACARIRGVPLKNRASIRKEVA